MNYWQQFLWVIFPYLCLMTFLLGHIYRYRCDQFGWGTRSSELMEVKSLRWGAMLFHFGVLAVLMGHMVGLFIPKAWTSAVGVTDELYHLLAVAAGGPAGVMTIFGIGLLTIRRLGNTRVAAAGSRNDWLIALLLSVETGIGLYNTFAGMAVHDGFDYRTTLGPWIRGLLILQPNPLLMAEVPLRFQLHVLLGFAIFAVWPFSRLVHVWSVPVDYLFRAPIVYRRKPVMKNSVN